MLRVYRAELRDSWPAWLGVSITFVVINACLGIVALTYWTGHINIEAGVLAFLDSAYYTIGQVILAVFIVFVSVPVIGSATGLVVDSRRGSLARLALAGATPSQVRFAMAGQLAVVSLLCSLIGSVLAVLAIPGWFALTIYTGTFIAEIVRSGIQAVSHGQTEAARSLGLPAGKTLRLVIIPQALRVIIPPLTSQYLNLAKNSSLAAGIGYPDMVSLFAGTTLNQTGQAIEAIAITMSVYLAISISISILMNWYNKRIALIER